MRTPATRRRSERGVTLVEAVISLAILLIGLVGMMRLQILGVTADAGGRSHTAALQLARELAASLERLEPMNALIEPPHFNTLSPPAAFGHVVQSDGTIATSGVTAWSDSTHAAALPGARTDAAIISANGKDPYDASLPFFQRRWSVWQAQTAMTTGGIKLIAVSVTYRERGLANVREVVLLTEVSNQGLASTFSSAFR